MMEAVKTSETSTNFYETTGAVSQKAIIYMLSAIRTWNPIHYFLSDILLLKPVTIYRHISVVRNLKEINLTLPHLEIQTPSLIVRRASSL